ncbi:MAG TPA: peptide-methionine (S)-S-oxide reductase MsrA [Thiobacillaceae bacterium]|nr:peptide-methionine (S)-S-oxide reductase MsrA [Thiobacillaceae bacterium]HNU63365.1 peptide-methionine (S)-S-oxide reductase MsrA [Thiobacillaceae bacterium]
MGLQTATLAGGCFWCLQSAFSRLQGVEHATAGYMGGTLEQPDYARVCTGETGHAEVVQVRFDAHVLRFDELLEVFFALHDPTTLNRQGNDVGSQYRSAVFFHTPEQAAQAHDMIAQLTHARLFVDPIVTQVCPATTFWPAEDYHQGYAERNPTQAYCRFVVAPKLATLRARFAARLKPS